MKAKEPLFDYVNPKLDYQIRRGDCLNVLKGIDDCKFDLIITSPPYNVGKSYETKTNIEKYLMKIVGYWIHLQVSARQLFMKFN